MSIFYSLHWFFGRIPIKIHPYEINPKETFPPSCDFFASLHPKKIKEFFLEKATSKVSIQSKETEEQSLKEKEGHDFYSIPSSKDILFDPESGKISFEERCCLISRESRGDFSLEYKICKFLLCESKELVLEWDYLYETIEDKVSDDGIVSRKQKRSIKDAIKRIEKKTMRDLGIKILSYDAGKVRKLFKN